MAVSRRPRRGCDENITVWPSLARGGPMFWLGPVIFLQVPGNAFFQICIATMNSATQRHLSRGAFSQPLQDAVQVAPAVGVAEVLPRRQPLHITQDCFRR